MNSTIVEAPSNASAGCGQLLKQSTEATLGTFSRQDLSNGRPARYSCSPGPWLGGPGMNKMFFSPAEPASVVATNHSASSTFFMALRLDGSRRKSSLFSRHCLDSLGCIKLGHLPVFIP